MSFIFSNNFLLTIILVTFTNTNGKLLWNRFEDSQALCNDFTRSGYFISSSINQSLPDNQTRWVIFLESGGVCSTPDDCNRRYTTFHATMSTKNQRISSVMSSLESFFEPELLSQGIEGFDILSEDPTVNPTYHDCIHVLVPYCTSDLWFGIGNDLNTTNFNFSDAKTENFQFTFRGSILLQSLFTELADKYRLNDAEKVLFSGSSAGGVALYNHAKTLQTFLSPSTELSILGDSSWFINFQESFELIKGSVLYYNLPAFQSCRLFRHGVPCCLSTPCMLTNPSFYPPDLKTLIVFSLYDIYLLNQTLGEFDKDNLLIFRILRIITEFGGAMNYSLQLVEYLNPNFSFIASSCLQHVFLATSSLWVQGPLGIFAGNIVESFVDSNFNLAIKPGIWTEYVLRIDEIIYNISSITIRDAITQWANGATISYRESCKSPHCNSKCPETITLGLGTPYWPAPVQYTLISVVLVIVILCVILKFSLSLRYLWIKRQQRRYVERHHKMRANFEKRGGVSNYHIMKCDPDDTVTLACLDIEYKVNISALAAKRLRYEEEDIEPLVLKSLDTVTEDMLKTLDRKQTRRRHTFSGKLPGETSVNDFQNISPMHHPKESSLGSMSDFPNDDDTILLKSSPRKIRKSQTMNLNDSPYKKKRLEKEDSVLFETLQRVASFPPEDKKKKSSIMNPLKQNSRTILKGISALFNPGELVAIMGPSGSGKTTLLDLLTGRRQVGSIEGRVFVNGFNVQSVRSWFIANTGYVLQQAQPFYEELTVRENLTLSAFMRLPSSMTLHHRLERVEEVLRETFLVDLADTKVGRPGGPGLSGGQKRRLSVAVQLLKRPTLLLLDEPTSGLDASSSYELLTYLNHVAASDRTVIVTIHQPRLEIFHLFNKIILLCRGQIAYHGVPEKAYEVFVNAHRAFEYTRGFKLPDIEKHNPADVIMDILGSKESRSAILSYYRLTEESEEIYDAICHAQHRRKKYFGPVNETYKGLKSSSFTSRVTSWEARASLRATWSQLIYLPLIFTVYGLLLGSAYKQASEALLIISGFCVYSVASALFMFPIMYTYFQPTLKIYAQERADGAGMASDLVFQGFVRFVSMAFIPVILCCAVLYLFVVQIAAYDPWVFFQVAVINLALNQTWIALLMFIIFCFPTIAHRISPIVASIAGFAGGFFVPIHLMPVYYNWLFFINPNFYGFSASARIILDNMQVTCEYESELECYTSSANYTLQQFDFINIQPYQHILVLLAMTVIFLFLAHTALWIRYFNWRLVLKSTRSKVRSDIVEELEIETYMGGSTEYNQYTTSTHEKRHSSVMQNVNSEFNWEIPQEQASQDWQPLSKQLSPINSICRNSIASGEQSYANFFENQAINSPIAPVKKCYNKSTPDLDLEVLDRPSGSRLVKNRSFKVKRKDQRIDDQLFRSSSFSNLDTVVSVKTPVFPQKNADQQIRDRQQNMYNRIHEYNLVSKVVEDEVSKDWQLTFRKKAAKIYTKTTKKIDKKLLEEMNFGEIESTKLDMMGPITSRVSNCESIHEEGYSTLPKSFPRDDEYILEPNSPLKSFAGIDQDDTTPVLLVNRRRSF
ncbi:hypothetical protein LOD99_50 [Oopsacas minuta]|uniref:ABC transporter domain-containing protein n=1 Tax=Oopsacas minuta TaxID=111878 RepID=A0AAV7K7S0_9METZ|nr:hypothetical protein LOD99_50 [Oopsacas minuta]